MSRPVFALLSLAAAVALAQEPPAAAPEQKLKLTVLPFAAVAGDVPSRAAGKAAGMLLQEFKSADTFTLVELKKDKTDDPFAAPLEAARKAVEEAKGLRAKRKFRLADEALQKALAFYRTGAPGVTDVAEVVDAWALLSAVQYNTGRDEDGAKSLSAALALAPDRELPLAATSVLFSKVVADARKVLKAGPKGTLLLESSPSGAPLTLDGVTLGSTPLQVLEVPAGQHYWRAQLPNGEVVGGVVDVAGGKTTKVAASASNKDPESRMLASLAANKLDPDLLAAAKEYAKGSEADLLLLGALSKEGKGLGLEAFLFVARSGEVRRLPRSQFDTELLSAGMEFFNLAGELAKKGAGTGDVVKVPSSVMTTPTAVGSKVAEVKYGVVPGQEAALELEPEAATPTKDEPRKPLDRRAPLKKK